MRIFVAGASGVIGRNLVPLLVAAGHEVAGMTRSTHKAEGLRALGATPVVCDVYNALALREAVVAFRPDVVIHQLTDLPDDVAQMAGFLSANNRIRREGTRNLLTAARAAAAPRFIAQSVAWQLPGDGGAAVQEHEGSVLAADGVVVRYGQLYGPGTFHETGRPPAPRVHVADAARRTLPALTAPARTILTITDDATPGGPIRGSSTA
ncbi:MAG: NAD-dependent epimerase/dehydratase family protein [Candidatus Limnocylindrales bacterium]